LEACLALVLALAFFFGGMDWKTVPLIWVGLEPIGSGTIQEILQVHSEATDMTPATSNQRVRQVGTRVLSKNSVAWQSPNVHLLCVCACTAYIVQAQSWIASMSRSIQTNIWHERRKNDSREA
jgi:hypothetical protein